jgi:hypothetical protein
MGAPTMSTATLSSTSSDGRSSRRPSRLFAADVAAAYAEATAAAEHTQEEIVWVALEIGEHLAELGRACEWHQIDGTALGRFTLTGELDDRISFLRLAAPMLVWLGETGQLDARRVCAILESLADAVVECPRSQRVVKRQLDRLRATASTGGEPVAVHDDAQSIAITVEPGAMLAELGPSANAPELPPEVA